jgi:hypothetical protein|tara:strand:+ start:193 stop:366 length:174 start_codon:yes stop_codon:yes gene_type:complete
MENKEWKEGTEARRRLMQGISMELSCPYVFGSAQAVDFWAGYDAECELERKHLDRRG